MFERNSFAPTLGVLLGILLVMTAFLAFSFGYLLDFEEPLFASFCIWAFFDVWRIILLRIRWSI